MLRLVIGEETFNDETQEFGFAEEAVLDLEHSLLAVSKWESKHQKPFLVKGDRTRDEIFDYIRAMVVTPDVDLGVLDRCTQENLKSIQDYIDSPQSATTFGVMPEHRGPGEIITSELIYFWLVNFNIPFEVENWHINRLFSLVRIANVKTHKQPRMSRADLARRNKELNEKRKAELGTSG